jgi:3-dehydroquinate synthase
MKTITVKSEHKYEVCVGTDAFSEIRRISKEKHKVLVLSPSSIVKKYRIKESKNLSIFITPDGENQKSVSALNRIWHKCATLGIQRSDAIIGIGGGATTDLAGFVAATWLRGIDWYAIPTSLAGMVDAAIGGKTGINSPQGKNLIGAFHSPIQVIVDTKFLQSLALRDLNAGMAEVIKCGFIEDYKILNLVQDEIVNFDELIYRSVRVKAKIVSQDFKESRKREILNYGHTLGHAIEKDSKYRLRHGEAVAIGMVFAAELSKKLAGLSEEAVELHRVLAKNYNLPITYPKHRLSALQQLMLRDKKVKSGKLRFIGLGGIGKPVWLEDIELGEIAEVYERIAK